MLRTTMATRKTTKDGNSVKNASINAKSSESSSNANRASSSGAAKKTTKSNARIVKSRYMQSAERSSLSKSNSLNNESMAAPPRPFSPKPSGGKSKPGTPTRFSVTPRATGMSVVSQSILQSTFADGPCLRPDLDISVIKEKTVMETPVLPKRNAEDEKELLDMQTFLLAYLIAKMEHNTAKLKAEAETKMLLAMEEEQRLRNEVQEKKRQYLLTENRRVVNELLDMQIASLTPVAETSQQFMSDYKSFAAAVDTTRHELPVKNFYIDDDRRQFLEKAETCLKESEKLLLECTEGEHKDNTSSLECLKNMKTTSKNISQQLSGACSELLELSSLVCRHTVHVQQDTEEQQLGQSRTRELYCPKE